MRMYVVYEWPRDSRSRYVVRGWTVLKEGGPEGALRADRVPMYEGEDLERARAAIPVEAAGPFGPDPEDEPVIKEVWL